MKVAAYVNRDEKGWTALRNKTEYLRGWNDALAVVMRVLSGSEGAADRKAAGADEPGVGSAFSGPSDPEAPALARPSDSELHVGTQERDGED